MGGATAHHRFCALVEEAQDYVVVTIVVDWVMVTQLLRLVLALALVNDEGRRREGGGGEPPSSSGARPRHEQSTMARDGRGRMGACVRTHLAPAMIGAPQGQVSLPVRPQRVDRDLCPRWWMRKKEKRRRKRKLTILKFYARRAGVKFTVVVTDPLWPVAVLKNDIVDWADMAVFGLVAALEVTGVGSSEGMESL